MNYRTVVLGRDYHGKIRDFASVRNSFLEQLGKDEYVFFLDSDEEMSEGLIRFLSSLDQANALPYYRVRRLNLEDGRYVPKMNPDMVDRLLSGRVRFAGKPTGDGIIMEGPVTPRKPYGVIDWPIIHNHQGRGYVGNPVMLRLKKAVLVALGQ